MITGIPRYTAPPPAQTEPRSPWPEYTPPQQPQDGVKLGAAGKLLGLLMDMPRPTRNKKLTPEQVDEIKQTLQPGDVLLECNDNYPGWELNAKVFLKSDWVHAALYVGNGTIIDATTERHGVAKTTVDDFTKCHHLAIVRPQYKTDADRQAALDYADKSLGVPYDFDWRLDNDTLYCTEFVANALKAGPNPIHVPTRHVLGQDMVSPQAFLQTPELKPVWSTGSNYFVNLLQRSRPFALQAAIGTAVGLGASAMGAGPLVSTALGVAVGGALFAGSMYRIYKQDEV